MVVRGTSRGGGQRGARLFNEVTRFRLGLYAALFNKVWVSFCSEECSVSVRRARWDISLGVAGSYIESLQLLVCEKFGTDWPLFVPFLMRVKSL